MQIHSLGTAGYHPNLKRHTSCFLVAELGLMLDAGTGLFRAGPLLETTTLEVLISHAHLDHVVGLTFLLDTVYESPVKRVRVWGEGDKLRAIREHLFHQLLFPILPEWIEFHPLPQGKFPLGRCSVSYQHLEHPGGSVGYRLDFQGHSLAYITDTVASLDAAYLPLIRGVDLLIHECNFVDALWEFAKQTGHSWTSAVATVARQAQVRRLALTHVNPLSSDEDLVEQLRMARAIFPETILAHDGLAIEF
jgi:ribonuclease BN (tRNA processing enzyme)